MAFYVFLEYIFILHHHSTTRKYIAFNDLSWNKCLSCTIIQQISCIYSPQCPRSPRAQRTAVGVPTCALWRHVIRARVCVLPSSPCPQTTSRAQVRSFNVTCISTFIWRHVYMYVYITARVKVRQKTSLAQEKHNIHYYIRKNVSWRRAILLCTRTRTYISISNQ